VVCVFISRPFGKFAASQKEVKPSTMRALH
jgi:hypothetical protein